MLKVISKKYEIEEPVQFVKNIDEKEEVIYEFTMQITDAELQELKDILFGFAKSNLGNYLKATKEEREELESTAEDEQHKKDERFIDICFKENKKCKDIVGEYKFEEMLESIRGYIMNFFMKKQISQYNTPITDLAKIMDNLQKLN